MKITSPIEITDARLVSSNVPTGDYPAWTAGEYNAGDRAVVGIEIYEAQTTTSDEPKVGERKDPATWLFVGFINRWRMLKTTRMNDGGVVLSHLSPKTSGTTNQGIIDVTLKMDAVYNSIALLGLEGAEIEITMTDGLTVVYNRTEQIVDIGVRDMWEWYFLPYSQIDRVYFSDLPPYANADLRIQVRAASETADAICGRVVVGLSKTLGITDYGTELSGQTFSRRERDIFGNLTTLPRRSIEIVTYDVTMRTADLTLVSRELQRATDTPSLFVGVPDAPYESTISFGLAEDFRENISGPVVSNLTLEVRSL